MSAELSTVPERQLAKKLSPIVAMLKDEDTARKLALVCPPGIDPKELLSVACGMVIEHPELEECTKTSVLIAIQKAMICGLPLDGRHGHLVPFNKKQRDGSWLKECKFIADWKGYVALGKRCGIEVIHPDVVCHADNYRSWVDETGPRFLFEYDHRNPRGPVVGAFCQTITKSGKMDVEYMHRVEIEAVQKRSKERSFSPWVSDWGEMAKKTVIRRMSKRWDIDTRYRAALADDEDPIVPGTKEVKLVMPDEALPPALGEPPKANLIEANAQVVPEGAEEELNPETGEYQWR